MDLRDLVAATSDDSNRLKLPTTKTLSPPSEVISGAKNATTQSPAPLRAPTANNTNTLPPIPLMSRDKTLPSPEPSPSHHFFGYNSTTLPQISSLHQAQDSSVRTTAAAARRTISATLPGPLNANAPPKPETNAPDLAPPRSLRKRKSSEFLTAMREEKQNSAIRDNSDSSDNEPPAESRRIKRRASSNKLKDPEIKRESSANNGIPPVPPIPATYQIPPQVDHAAEQQQSPGIALTTPPTISSTSSSSRRHAHILSEQRRRENINGGFQLLKNSVPFCKGTQDSKAMILKKAVDYIVSLEQELSQLRYQDPNYHYQMMNHQNAHGPAGPQAAGPHPHPPPPVHHPHHMRPNSSPQPPYYPMPPQSHPGPSASPIPNVYEQHHGGQTSSPHMPPSHLPIAPPPRTDTPPAPPGSAQAAGFFPGPPPLYTGKRDPRQPEPGTNSRAMSFSHTFPRSVRGSGYFGGPGGGGPGGPGGSYGPGGPGGPGAHIVRPTSTPPLHSYSLNPPETASSTSDGGSGGGGGVGGGNGANSALQYGKQILRPQTAAIAETAKP